AGCNFNRPVHPLGESVAKERRAASGCSRSAKGHLDGPEQFHFASSARPGLPRFGPCRGRGKRIEARGTIAVSRRRKAMSAQFTVVGLGELLWDMFPQGKHLGGAPANFAYMTALLGNRGIVASRVGRDRLGQEAIWHLKSSGLDTGQIQLDPVHATGT